MAALLLLGSLPSGSPLTGQETSAPGSSETETAAGPENSDEEEKSKSGYDALEEFGGSRSIEGKLKQADKVKRSRFGLGALDRALEPWWETKRRISERIGLSFAGIYKALYQDARDNPDEAAGGVFQLLGTWTLIGEGRTAGSLGFQLEHRHRLGTELAPEALGVVLGSAVSSATDFGDFGLALTRFYWRQGLDQGRVVFLAGRVDPGDYVDTFPLNDPLAHFLNESLVASPTIAAPEPGLGGGLGAFLHSGVYLVAGLSDANGSFTRSGFDTFFEDRELFKHLEIGWVPSFERRYDDNVHLTAWHVDERQAAGTPEAWGLNVSLARTLDDRLVPFLRMGWSEGGAAPLEATVSGGLGLELEQGDQFGLGGSWGRPPGHDARDQYTLEVFYRLQVTSDLALTPNVQLVLDPALDPARGSLVVYTVRAGLAI